MGQYGFEEPRLVEAPVRNALDRYRIDGQGKMNTQGNHLALQRTALLRDVKQSTLCICERSDTENLLEGFANAFQHDSVGERWR